MQQNDSLVNGAVTGRTGRRRRARGRSTMSGAAAAAHRTAQPFGTPPGPSASAASLSARTTPIRWFGWQTRPVNCRRKEGRTPAVGARGGSAAAHARSRKKLGRIFTGNDCFQVLVPPPLLLLAPVAAACEPPLVAAGSIPPVGAPLPGMPVHNPMGAFYITFSVVTVQVAYAPVCMRFLLHMGMSCRGSRQQGDGHVHGVKRCPDEQAAPTA